MCRDCETKCHKPKQCVKKKVICSLPYTINKPGEYCLGKNFEWSDPTRSAIIVNSDNVVLNFNEKLIETKIDSTEPLVKIENSKDVELNKVHLKASESVDQSFGISLVSCCNVSVNKASLLNLNNFSLFADEINGLKIQDLFLKNSVARENGVLIKNSLNITYTYSKVTNARSRFIGSENIIVDNLQAELLGAYEPASSNQTRALQFEQLSKNFQVRNSNLVAQETIDVFGDYDSETDEYIPLNFIIEQNVLKALSGNASGIVLIGADAFTIRKNQITCNSDGNIGTGGIVILSGRHGTISDNMISANLVSFNWGILIASLFGQSGYFTVKENFVTHGEIGYTDNASAFGPGTEATCVVFKDNIGTGNIINNNFIDPTTIESNNIFGCELLEMQNLNKSVDTKLKFPEKKL